jgi:hypothetical protein
VQEVDGEDPGGLGLQELPPGRACASRRRVNARGMQDLPHGGRRNGEAEFRQLAVDAAVSPQRILLRQVNDEACGARECRRAAGLAPVARLILSRCQPALPGQQRCGRDGEDIGPAPRGMSRASAANDTRSVGSSRTRPAWRGSTAFSCRSTSSSASFAVSVRNTRAARPSSRRISR